MNEISCYIYEYLAQTAELKVVNSIVKMENEVGYEVSYMDKDKFKNDYLAGRLEFTARPDETFEALLAKINADIEATGVKAIQNSTLVTGASPEDLQAPAPTESVIAKKINKSTAIRMKDANKEIDWFNPSQFAEKVAEGWTPTRGEFLQYPILTEDDKVKWTVEVNELGAVFAPNQKILIFDVARLKDAEMFRQMFPEKNYPDTFIVASDTTAPAKVEEPAPEVAQGTDPAEPVAPVPPTPSEMPQIPDAGNAAPAV